MVPSITLGITLAQAQEIMLLVTKVRFGGPNCNITTCRVILSFICPLNNGLNCNIITYDTCFYVVRTGLLVPTEIL